MHTSFEVGTIEAGTIRRFKDEISRLTARQTQALQAATFVGMTADEAKAYEARLTTLKELTEQLERLNPAA